ncbi:hypothetical protein ACWDTP_00320 [Mycobacterium sp. NPDC003449]
MGAMTTDDHDAFEEATAWIADATRELAGLDDGPGAHPGATSPYGTATLEQLRAGIAHRVLTLPRQSRQVETSSPAITFSQLALAKALTWALAEPAAAVSAAIADVAVQADGRTLSGVHIHLVAVGADERERTYLDDGDALRGRAATVITDTLGVAAPRITITWEDIVLPE